MKVGDLVRKKETEYNVANGLLFKSSRVHIVTETRINWIKVLTHGKSVGWLREDDWELVNESR